MEEVGCGRVAEVVPVGDAPMVGAKGELVLPHEDVEVAGVLSLVARDESSEDADTLVARSGLLLSGERETAMLAEVAAGGDGSGAGGTRGSGSDMAS